MASQLEFFLLTCPWLLSYRPQNIVDFWFTVVLDLASVHDVNAGSAAWFLHCVPRRLKYAFGENPNFFSSGDC